MLCHNNEITGKHYEMHCTLATSVSIWRQFELWQLKYENIHTVYCLYYLHTSFERYIYYFATTIYLICHIVIQHTFFFMSNHLNMVKHIFELMH